MLCVVQLEFQNKKKHQYIGKATQVQVKRKADKKILPLSNRTAENDDICT
jgi:hypothetical protein